MEMVRIFIIKNNRKSFLDVQRSNLEEMQAQIALDGGEVYHARVLPKPVRRTKAKLRKRVY